MRHNDASKMIPSPCHVRHSQNFDRVDGFIKLILNIVILRNLIVVWGRGLLKTGLVFCIRQIHRFRAGVKSWGGRIHQNKSRYHLRHFQTSKVKPFAKIVLDYKLLTFFVKSSKLDVCIKHFQ